MLPREKNTLVVAALLCLARLTHQYGSGAPPVACLDQIPRHSDIQPQSSVPPYGLFPSTAQVRQGDTLNVTIASPYGAPLPIGGFIMQAREIQDTEKIVGKFTSIPDPVATRIISCRGENDTVTHGNPEDKPPLTFVWQAPQDFLGGIAFRATVAQGYATFWKNIESPLVEVVSPDTVITTRAPPTTTPRETPAPPVIMESKPQTTPPPLDTIYQGCADTKLCFGVPENCAPSGTCQAIVAVFVAGDEYTFEIQGSGNPKYIAAGLSVDNKMGDDSAMECVRNDNGRVSLFTSWTYAKEEPYVRRSDSPQDIVQLQESSVIDGKLYCKFKRNAVSVVKGQTFDMANNKYNLMVVSGESMKDENRVGFHSLVYASTGAPVALSSVGNAGGASKLLLKLHGSFMVAAWIGSASLGILLARYFKKTWVGKTLGGKDIWFAYHRILMVLTWVLTMAGFVVILIEVGGYSTTGDNPHAITGLVTVILCFLQPIGAFFRPHPGTKHRPIFNWMHWLAGNAAHILGIATIFLAVYLQKAELPAWTVFLLAAFVAFHVILHLILSLSGCLSEGRVAGARVDAFPLKDMLPRSAVSPRPEHGADAPFSKFRKHLLGVYAPIIVLFAIALVCLVALAPIGVTYNSLMGS